MVPYLGDFAEDATVYIMFNTFTSDDPSASCTITNFANTDVHIHKDDGLTQRNNAAGVTVSVDFDGITGSHMIKIDTSDDTVAGFWVVGHDYFVRIEGTTVDGATLNVVVAHFSIENRFQEVDVVKWLGQACHAVSENGVPKVDVDQIGGDTQSQADLKDFADAGYDPSTNKITGCKANDDMRGTDGANTTVPDAAGVLPTAVEIRQEIDSNSARLDADISSRAPAGEYDTEMGRITGNVATAAKLLAYIQLLARSDAAIETDNATELSEINADEGSGAGNFSAQTDSEEALRDHIGDGTNLTEAGGDGDHLTEAGGTGDQFTAIPWNSSWDAEVESECNDALVALNLDHLMKTAVANNADMTTEVPDGTVLSNIMTKGSDTSTFAVATDSLEGLRDTLPAAIWDLASAITLDFGTLMERIYQLINNKMTVTDSTGAATLRNIGDSSDLATWSITDDDTTTTKTEASWS